MYIWVAQSEWLWGCRYICKPWSERVWEGWFKATKTCKCSKCSFESVWIDVKKHNETVTIGGMYRHPGGNTAHFNTAVEVTLSKLNKNDSCIMTVDVNINLLNIDGTITTDYISSVMSHGFVPYITRPTRITEYTATLIDHLFVRLPRHKVTAPVKAGILFNDITDHLPIFLYLLVQSKCQRNQRPRVRIFSNTNIQKIVDKIASVNWLHVLNHHMKYMEYRKILNACIKHVEESYYQQILSDRSNSAKYFWKHFGTILNSNKKHKCNISSLQVDGGKVTKDHAIADAFNDFFSNVGSNLDRKIGHQNTNFRQYLKNRISSSFFFAPILESDVREEYWNWMLTKPVGQMI